MDAADACRSDGGLGGREGAREVPAQQYRDDLVGFGPGVPQDPDEVRRCGLRSRREVSRGAEPITNGEAGARIVRLLEAASESMAAQGRLVTLAQTV